MTEIRALRINCIHSYFFPNNKSVALKRSVFKVDTVTFVLFVSLCAFEVMIVENVDKSFD